MKQNRWTIRYRSLTYIYLVRAIYVSQWFIIPTMMFIHQIILKILSKIIRPWNIGHVDIFTLRSKFGHCLIIWKYNNHASNSLGNIKQNHWTMKYRSHWPTFILRSNVGSYWLIIPNNNVNTSNSLQDIRQNHWTVKYRSCWSSLHDPQVHITKFSRVQPTICISCCHIRKSRKTIFKGVLVFDL